MNLPNKITFSRIILLPVFLAVGLINFPYSNFVALGLFILLAVSDFLDGYIARKYNMVTNLGKFLDPIADKLLCTTGLLLLIVGANPIIPHPYGIVCVFIILLRDYAVTGLRQVAQLKGIIIPADKLGKIKANFQYVMTVYGFLIGGLRAIESVNGTGFLTYFTLVFYIFVGITTAIVLISGLAYIFKNLDVFKEEKVEQPKTEEKQETVKESELAEEPSTQKKSNQSKKASSTSKKTTASKKTTTSKSNKTTK